ncbi:MAG: TIGR04282 family arsenosugar biosynthesis glycosyltransferase [Desulfuromonadaceae bacterium]
MRNAIVVFTKVPKAGDSKTRLTTDRGGILTTEEAKEFYVASLLDVVDCCVSSHSCDVYLCYNKGGDRSYLNTILEVVDDPHAIKDVFPDNGGTFDKGMQYAVDHILKNGAPSRLADSVLILGGDIPSLQQETIRKAVRTLEKLACSDKGALAENGESSVGAAMVVSADQECGFNILGYTCTTPFNFDGVFYNLDGVTALDMVTYKAMEQCIPFAMLEIVPDVDVPVDLAGFISVVKVMQLAEKYDSSVLLPKRTIKVLEELGLEASAPVPAGMLAHSS